MASISEMSETVVRCCCCSCGSLTTKDIGQDRCVQSIRRRSHIYNNEHTETASSPSDDDDLKFLSILSFSVLSCFIENIHVVVPLSRRYLKGGIIFNKTLDTSASRYQYLGSIDTYRRLIICSSTLQTSSSPLQPQPLVPHSEYSSSQ